MSAMGGKLPLVRRLNSPGVQISTVDIEDKGGHDARRTVPHWNGAADFKSPRLGGTEPGAKVALDGRGSHPHDETNTSGNGFNPGYSRDRPCVTAGQAADLLLCQRLSHREHKFSSNGLSCRRANVLVGKDSHSGCQCQRSFLRLLATPRRYWTTTTPPKNATFPRKNIQTGPAKPQTDFRVPFMDAFRPGVKNGHCNPINPCYGARLILVEIPSHRRP